MTIATAPEDPTHDAGQPWARMATESAQAYRAFRCYLDLGPDRSIDHVGLEICPPRASGEGRKSRKRGSTGRISEWCSRHNWVRRALAWDDHLAAAERAAKVRAAQESAELWAKRRQEMLEDNWGRSRRLAELADSMLACPPEKWAVRDVAAIAKAAADLAAAAVVDGIMNTDDGFDPLDPNVTPQQLREYLERMGVKPPAGGASKPGG